MSTIQKVPPLRRYLDRHGMTVAEFHRRFNRASKLRVSDVSVSYWARGIVNPRIYHQAVIRRITGGEVTPSDWAEWFASRAAHSGPHDDGSRERIQKNSQMAIPRPRRAAHG